jgi:nitroimidazol reductase NimA-like FMN-containing flavoprotein (pyridoxamine 5'-phosphate oxidase superfamily)
MPYGKRDLTDAEREEFIASNRFGVLALGGDKPYAIPVAYKYIKGAMVFAMLRAGRKMEYIKKNPNACFNIWQMGDQTTVSSLKDLRYISVLMEGELVEVTGSDWAYYEMPTPPEGVDMVAFRLKIDNIGCSAAIQG